MIGKLIYSFCFLLLSTAIAAAQTQVSAFTDKQTLALNEYLILTVTISGDNANSAKVDIPSMPNFSASSSARSTQISIINGRISSSVEYTYYLSPKYIGKTTIPPIPVSIGKEKFLTKEIEITVTAARASQPYQNYRQQSPNIPQSQRQNLANRPQKGTPLDKLVFVKAETDKKTAYPGEQITMRFRFYTAIPIARNPEYYPPKLSNLFLEDLPPISNGEEIINGVRYYYSELKTALFAINSGKASIGPAEVIAQIQKEEDLDPFDPNFMQKFFSGFTNYEEVRRKTSKIDLNILPLGENAPKEFSGAVGNFFISSILDKKETKQGEPLNLTLKITGKGNIKDISMPELNDDEIKVYDSLSSYNLTKHNGIVGGEKKITYIISFKEAGYREIPPIKFCFFNIDTKKYETIYTQPIKVKVLKSETSKSYDFSSPSNSGSVQVKGEDIKYLIPSKGSAWVSFSDKLGNVSFYPHILAISLLIFSFLKNRSLDKRFRNPKLYAFKKAEFTFKKALEESAKQQDQSKALAIIYDAIMDYLSAKLMENVYSLPISKISATYRQKVKGASEFTSEEIKSILEEIEMLNYASSKPTEEKVRETRERAENLCEMIEKETGK